MLQPGRAGRPRSGIRSAMDLQRKTHEMIPQLTVASVSASVKFYTKRLGYIVEMSDPPTAPEFVQLVRGDSTLFLVSKSSREEASQLADLQANKVGVGMRLYLEVDDAKALHKELAAARVPILRALAYNEKEDYTEFSVVDPDGYEIGIFS